MTDAHDDQTPQVAEPWGELTLTDRLEAALTEANLEHAPLDGVDNAYAFHVGDQGLVVEAYPGAPDRVRIFAAWDTPDATPAELVRRLSIVNDLNAAILAVKGGITEKQFVAAAEFVVPPLIGLQPYVVTGVQGIDQMLRAFQERLDQDPVTTE